MQDKIKIFKKIYYKLFITSLAIFAISLSIETNLYYEAYKEFKTLEKIVNDFSPKYNSIKRIFYKNNPIAKIIENYFKNEYSENITFVLNGSV